MLDVERKTLTIGITNCMVGFFPPKKKIVKIFFIWSDSLYFKRGL